MNRSSEPKGNTQGAHAGTLELFDNLFKKIEAGTQQFTNVPASAEQQQNPAKLPDPEKKAVTPAPPPPPRKLRSVKRPAPVKIEKDLTTIGPKGKKSESKHASRAVPDTAKKSVKSYKASKAALAVILVAILTATVLGAMGFIDISFVLGYFGHGHEQVAQAPVPTKHPVRPPEKAAGAPEPKTSITSAQAEIGPERLDAKASLAAARELPKPLEAPPKPEPQQAPVLAQAPAKASEARGSLQQPLKMPQYPYSLHLGSFKAPEAVSKAISEFQGRGLSPYSAKVDLGDKGVWSRIFSGYFRSKEEVDKFIRDQAVQGGEAWLTKYANLIGIYGSDKEVESQKQALLSAGFYPYVIKGDDGKILLYSGAFDRKEYAEKDRSALASKGIRSEVVER